MFAPTTTGGGDGGNTGGEGGNPRPPRPPGGGGTRSGSRPRELVNLMDKLLEELNNME